MNKTIISYSQININYTPTGAVHCLSFNGKEKDYESGLHYYGARYYWSETMTGWLSVDPMADKYPNISPYAYCSWNPVKLVDPDGKEAMENDDWYKNRKGEMRWFNSSAETYTHEGEEYTRHGKMAYMTNSDGEFVYGDQYGHAHQSAPLKEVSITGNRTDLERTMQNPIVQDIHKSAADFWGNPVTMGVVVGVGALIGASELMGLCSQVGIFSSSESIVFTQHAAQRASERGFTNKDIQKIIKKGELVKSPDRYSEIQNRYTYHNNTVIVNDKGKVVTVYGNGKSGKIHK